MIEKWKNWIEEHPDLWEFVKFNVLSNVATIVNFCVLWVGANVLFATLSNQPFEWFIFNYTTDKGGLGGFLSFLVAYISAQVVNYFVQRKFVFGATNGISSTLHWYILTVVVAGILSIVLPPYTIELFTQWGFSLGIAQIFANVINIFVQVALNYPMMKFVIMK